MQMALITQRSRPQAAPTGTCRGALFLREMSRTTSAPTYRRETERSIQNLHSCCCWSAEVSDRDDLAVPLGGFGEFDGHTAFWRLHQIEVAPVVGVDIAGDHADVSGCLRGAV